MQWKKRSEVSVASAPMPPEYTLWAQQLEISEALAAILFHRGFTTKEALAEYLNPSLRSLAGLDLWPGLEDAAVLLGEKLLNGASCCVWGDYDVDGITATALVTEFMQAAGFACRQYIPNRLTEGYGLNSNAITQLAAEGVTLLLTVDSGISDTEAITHAKSLGMTVIISDHHLPGEILPPADAIINPRLVSCPCPALAGVGVAFFLMAALNVYLHSLGRAKVDIRVLLDLVALGTLADVVSLTGQNRILVKNGLLKIAQGVRVGMAALKNSSGFAPTAALGAGQVVFTLAPRVNAAGRLGSSSAALDLMLTQDRETAHQLAETLSKLNVERREEEERIYAHALLQAQAQVEKGHTGLVLHAPDWHPGIIGIVASRIVEVFYCPTVVLSATENYMKGSGRSISHFDIHEAFCACSDLFLGFGGHSMAAGLSLVPENLERFRERFNSLVRASLGESKKEQTCLLDAELPFTLASDFTFLKELELLQPFGMGNPEPVFSSLPLLVRNMRSKTGLMLLDLTEEASGITLKGKAWRSLANMPTTLKGQRIRIAYTPRIDRYNGIASVEVTLKDWKQ